MPDRVGRERLGSANEGIRPFARHGLPCAQGVVSSVLHDATLLVLRVEQPALFRDDRAQDVQAMCSQHNERRWMNEKEIYKPTKRNSRTASRARKG